MKPQIHISFLLTGLASGFLNNHARMKSPQILKGIREHPEVVENMQVGHLDAFARLASRWARPGGLAIEDIEQVRPVALDRHHLELEVITCEDDGCVSILVPIEFPEACSTDDDVECFVKNIEALDGEAVAMSRLSEKNDDPSSTVWRGGEPPAWWVEADEDLEPEVFAECKSIVEILDSDDFMHERRTLVGHATQLDAGTAVRCVQACPSGLLFHVQRHSGETHSPSQLPGVEVISLRFQRCATTVPELRSAVLTAVSAAEPEGAGGDARVPAHDARVPGEEEVRVRAGEKGVRVRVR